MDLVTNIFNPLHKLHKIPSSLKIYPKVCDPNPPGQSLDARLGQVIL